MAKASTSIPDIHGNPATAAADAVLALINSKPQTPRREEIAAIFAKAMPASDVRTPKHRAEWDALSAEVRAADAKCDALDEASGGITTKEFEAAEEEAGAINERRLSDCAERILAEPVRGSADLMLLAEACYWIMWTEPYGLTAPNADERLAYGPPHAFESSGCIDALAALFRGIRDATRGASSSQPIADLARWDAKMREYVAYIEVQAKKLYSGKDEVSSYLEQFREEAERIWAKPVRDWSDVIMRAAIAVHWNGSAYADGPGYPDEVIRPQHQSDESMDDRSLALLVRGVLDMAGLAFDNDGRLRSGAPNWTR